LTHNIISSANGFFLFSGHSDIDRDYELYKNMSNTTKDVETVPLTREEYDGPYKQLCRANTKVKTLYKNYFIKCYESSKCHLGCTILYWKIKKNHLLMK
jgi:hypothetical protein